MRNISLSALDLLTGSPWSLIPPEIMLVPVVHAAAQVVIKPKVHVDMKFFFATDLGLGDVLELCCLRKSCRCEWLVA